MSFGAANPRTELGENISPSAQFSPSGAGNWPGDCLPVKATKPRRAFQWKAAFEPFQGARCDLALNIWNGPVPEKCQVVTKPCEATAYHSVWMLTPPLWKAGREAGVGNVPMSLFPPNVNISAEPDHAGEAFFHRAEQEVGLGAAQHTTYSKYTKSNTDITEPYLKVKTPILLFVSFSR